MGREAKEAEEFKGGGAAAAVDPERRCASAAAARAPWATRLQAPHGGSALRTIAAALGGAEVDRAPVGGERSAAARAGLAASADASAATAA